MESRDITINVPFQTSFGLFIEIILNASQSLNVIQRIAVISDCVSKCTS
jgi:hypothetical protein